MTNQFTSSTESTSCNWIKPQTNNLAHYSMEYSTPDSHTTSNSVYSKDKSECVKKKPPTAFIFAEDWGSYLQTSCKLRHIQKLLECSETEALRIIQSGKHGRSGYLVRLVASFNHLYADYSRLVDRINTQNLLSMRSQGDASLTTCTPFSPSSRPNYGQRQSGDYCVTNNDNEAGDPETAHHGGIRYKYPVSQTSGDKHDDLPPQKQVQNKLDRTKPLEPFAHMNPSTEHRSITETLSPTYSKCVTHKEPTNSACTVINSNSISLQLTPGQISGTSHETYSYTSSHSLLDPLLKQSHERFCFSWCRVSGRKKQIKPGEFYRDILSNIKKDRSLLIDQGYYDKITRQPAENTLLVYQTMHHQMCTEHRARIPKQLLITPSMLSSSNEFFALTFANENVITIRLPIALELILPKMQRQIEDVLRRCSNVYDPLEVAAELRQVNYDSDACVAYFKRTQPLRDIIEEFLPCRKRVSRISSDFITNKLSKSRKSSRSSNTTCGMSLSKSTVIAFLFQLQSTLEKLKKEQANTFNRLNELREFVLEATENLSRALAKRIVESICSSAGIQQLISGKHSDLPISQLTRLAQENQTLKLALRQEENRRKSVFNMMQEYLGNIRVFCRCRTVPQCGVTCLQVRSIDTVVLYHGADGNGEPFKFDRVFPSQASQAEVYTELLPAVSSFLDGYNVCFLTYGGEASGKTYTLLGSEDGHPERQGIAHRALRTILMECDARQHDWQYRLTVAVVEIYNDTLMDLLANEASVHVRADLGLEQMLGNLKSMPIDSENDIDYLLSVCRTRRRKGRTALNAQSSRSHLLLFYQLHARSNIDCSELCSVLALCDLAGFEDIIKADTQADPTLAKEAGYINRSLTALNRVFMALRSQDPNAVSYRDSKLTYLLKPFFTFSGKCLLIVTVRTDKSNLASTQSTLRFGRESRGVVLGRARRQFNLDKLIEDMRTV